MNARVTGQAQLRVLHLSRTRVFWVALAGLVLALALFLVPAHAAFAQSGSMECLSLTMGPTTMINGAMGASYTQTFWTTQNWNCCATLPFKYSIYSGSLPTGLSLSASGTVSGTPVRPGSWTFTLKSEDSGNKPNGYHCEGYVSVTVTGTNAAPTFTGGPDVTLLEDAPAYNAAWATNISPGDGAAEALQTLTFTATNDNSGLFSVQPAIAADGKLSFAVKPNANGVANVSVYLKDNGGTANGGSDTSTMAHFVLTVTPVDDVQAGPAFAVNSTAWATDGACTEGNCTLREAIAAANADGVASTIALAAGATYIISGIDNTPGGIGSNGLPEVTSAITINGHGAVITRDTAVASVRFFHVVEPKDPRGGGNLTLNEVDLENGLLTGGYVGGAIMNDGTLVVLNSLLQYNAAVRGGAIYNQGTASLYNNTFYANVSGEGAVYTSGQFSMYSSTLFNNTLSGGVPASSPAALVLSTCGSSNCALFNNLIASSNSATPLCRFDVSGMGTAGNVATDSTCKFFTTTSYTLAKTAAAPDYNGGPTRNVALLQGSSAVDVGYLEHCQNANIAGRDQRRYARVFGSTCDAGAYEYGSSALPPTAGHETNPPQVTVTLTPATPDGLNGWYRTPVHVDPQASDDTEVKQLRCMLDPVTVPAKFDDLPDAPCPRPDGGVVSADGEHTVYAAARDVFGNTSDVIAAAFKIDATAPYITCPMAGPFLLGSGDHAIGPVGVEASVSGLNEAASILTGNVRTDTVGPKTLIFKAVDLAGNEVSEGCAYLVKAYEWAGFYAPVKNPPTMNKATAGQAVPVKFSLGGDGGLEVIAVGYPTSQQVDCKTLAPLGAATAAKPAGGSALSYDVASGWYNYVWKTGKGWAGTCRMLALKLADTTEHQAYFQFK